MPTQRYADIQAEPASQAPNPQVLLVSQQNQMWIDDPWLLIQQPDDLISTPADKRLILPLPMWRELLGGTSLDLSQIGVWVDNQQQFEAHAQALAAQPLVALRISGPDSDWCYGAANHLRASLKFGGELRAFGPITGAQLFYLHRCGFNSFSMPAGQAPSGTLSGLNSRPTQPPATPAMPAPSQEH
ncbi:MAG: DUF934 domain-containing protein [Curvibacter lanceolatus]|jgi:uncharacterized protein (DUF934 family)|uniref:DUF934 domain-containing protein n=1 Tax=Curvibacter lanceolatus TaxID=86182 RepID=UPI0023535A9D|nr:DUF934 domain-containing protein [Curvibacter lanceolatus]MBV5291491.1 DUF934 domain-containing protein [Curvibacter lanceolatus]